MQKSRYLPTLFLLVTSFFTMAPSFSDSAKNFHWGVANSAFQVEGFPEKSDWQDWTHTPDKIKDKSTADKASEFWNRYEEDIQLAANLGVNSFRLSIAWDRVEKVQGHFDDSAISKYKKIILALRKKSIEPFVTLHHFVNPHWLAKDGGLLSPIFVESFKNYSQKIVQELSAAPYNVRYFFTFNEPMVLINAGFLEGIWPPGLKDPNAALAAALNLSKAHIVTYRNIKADPNLKHLQIGIAKHWRVFEGKGLLGAPLAALSDWFFNHQILKSLTTSQIYFWMPGAKSVKEDLRSEVSVNQTLDFLGINYYGRIFSEFQWKAPFVKISEGPGPKSDLGWEIYSKGLSLSLKASSRYGVPIFVSENGVADHKDTLRSQFLKDHITELKNSKASGIDVRGYFHWSLTDNFEWAEGLESRFGLVEIDYEKQKRIPRPSYYEYQRLIKEGF